MGWIIFTGLVSLVTAGCIVTFLVARGDAQTYAAGIAALAVVGWGAISLLVAYNTVGQLHVGLVYNYDGRLLSSVGPGRHWLAPWKHMKTENIGLQKEEFILDQGNAAVSSDQQQIFADVQLNYEVQPLDVVKLYKTVGPTWKSILLEGRMLQDFKQVTSTYTAAQITVRRAQLRTDTKAAMVGELEKYGIRVVDVLIKNLGYSDAYRDAITQKTIQVQKALQAEAKVAQAKAEANQAIATATGEARSNVVRATAQARATILAATAEAKALAAKGAALRNNPDILRLEAIDKLNPNAQVIICTGTGSDNCPSFLPQASTGGG